MMNCFFKFIAASRSFVCDSTDFLSVHCSGWSQISGVIHKRERPFTKGPKGRVDRRVSFLLYGVT